MAAKKSKPVPISLELPLQTIPVGIRRGWECLEITVQNKKYKNVWDGQCKLQCCLPSARILFGKFIVSRIGGRQATWYKAVLEAVPWWEPYYSPRKERESGAMVLYGLNTIHGVYFGRRPFFVVRPVSNESGLEIAGRFTIEVHDEATDVESPASIPIHLHRFGPIQFLKMPLNVPVRITLIPQRQRRQRPEPKSKKGKRQRR